MTAIFDFGVGLDPRKFWTQHLNPAGWPTGRNKMTAIHPIHIHPIHIHPITSIRKQGMELSRRLHRRFRSLVGCVG